MPSHLLRRVCVPCGQGIRAFNLCAIARLSSDLAAVQSWAEEVGVPNLSQEIAEPVQLCALLLSNKVR